MSTPNNSNDVLVGTAGNDQLYGYGGDDVISGGAGRDYLDGGAGNDLLQGGEGDDNYLFSAGHDRIIDTSGSDTLILRGSTNFANLVFTRRGTDLIIRDKTADNEVTIVDHFGSGTIEKLRLADLTSLDLRSGLLTVVTNVVTGSAGVDLLHGTDGIDDIRGGAGNDQLYGYKGDDTLRGEAGNDYLDGGEGNDQLFGGDGNDSYMFSGGSDTITDTSGTWDVVTLRNSVSLSDLTFKQSGRDLVITDTRLASQLIIKEQFGAGAIEYLKHNGELLSLDTLIQAPSGGSSPSATPRPASTGFTLRAEEHDFGGVGENYYRGAGFTDRAVGDGNPNDAAVVQVALGTTVVQLEKMIAEAAAGTTFQLQAGTYVFNDRLDIRRSDVTLKGAGEDKTIIKTTVEGTDTIRVQAAWQKEALGNIEPSEAKLNTTLATAAGDAATVVQLKSVAGLKVGDFLEISQTYNQYRDDGNDDYIGALVEIKAINPATGKVTLEHQLGFDAKAGATVRAVELLHNVVLGDFTLDYGAPKRTVDPYRYENNNPQYIGVDKDMGVVGSRAIFLNSLTDSGLYNVTIKNAGSNAVFVREAVDVNINGLTVDGVQNLGDGGNGYGLEIARTYFSDFENLTFKGLIRHAVTYAKDGSSGFNNVHVLSSTANVDFHGGPDYSNIYYIEEMNLPMYKDDYAHPAVEYRDENNAWENIAIVDKLTAPEAVKISKYITDYKAINYSGKDAAGSMNDYSGVRDDIIHGGVNGSTVSLGGGNDIFYSGAGNDTIFTGTGKDKVVIGAGNGRDVVADFDTRNDVVALDHVTGFTKVSDIFAHLTQTSNGAQLDLGGGNTLLLMGVDMKDLSQNDFLIM